MKKFSPPMSGTPTVTDAELETETVDDSCHVSDVDEVTCSEKDCETEVLQLAFSTSLLNAIFG